MRGEEGQVLGALAAGSIDPMGLVCHPGTHNKWVVLRHGKIREFRTVMTGELFNLLKEHGILSDFLTGKVEANDAFKNAARHAIDCEELTADLFTVRARILLGQARKEDAASYTSGLLIGSDVRIGLTFPVGPQIAIIGRPELTCLYAAVVGAAAPESV